MKSLFAITLFLFSFCLCKYSHGSKDSSESQLIKNLFQGYSKYAKPTINASGTVQMLFGVELVQVMSVMMPNQVLRSKVWVRMKWKNELMTWNTSDFDGIKSVRLNAVDVWTPDIQLYEQFESSKTVAENVDGLLFKTQVVLENDGTTYWNAPATFTSTCKLDVADFPYDTQICHLKFGPWNSDITFLNMTADTMPLTTDKYVESSEWELLSVRKKRSSNLYACCANPYTDVTISLEIRRKPLFYWFNLVIPYALLLLCLWVGYFVPPQSGERISLSLVILLAFSIIVQATSSFLPRSNELPALSILYFVVMIEVAVSALATCLIVRVHFKSERGHKAPMPNWLHENLLLKGENFLSKIGLLSKTMRQAEFKEVSRARELRKIGDVDEVMNEIRKRKTTANSDEFPSQSGDSESTNDISVSFQSRHGSLWKCSIGRSETNQSRERSASGRRRQRNDGPSNESKLCAILIQIRTITNCFHDDVIAWEFSHKWQRLAVVLDRFFFIALSLFTVFTFLSFTVIRPAVSRHEHH